MNVLIVYAHPEPRSLNGALKDFTVARLRKAGHAVEVSDLYAMGWKALVDGDDFPVRDRAARLFVAAESKRAYASRTQTRDVEAEQRKLVRADAVIMQFPFWWFSMPAILKGWVERVYAYGFGYGVGEHSDRKWGDRYGEGTFLGKRAMLSVTTGGWAPHYSERGINGNMADLLFPINHGVLFYAGFDVLPPFVVHDADRLSEPRFQHVLQELGARLDGLWETAPLPYRKQNGGDYTIPSCELRPELAAGRSGLGIHLATR